MRNAMRRFVLAAVLSVLSGTAALAHPGAHPHLEFAAGFAHPVTGLDHVLAMVAVGLWASQLGGRAMWLLPLTFPMVMAAGAAIGMGGLALPWAEIGIAGSVLVLGAAIALGLRPSLAVSLPLIALFALVHGYAHGVELPADTSALSYSAGFVAATAALHIAGLALGLIAARMPLRFAARSAGGAIAVIGVVLLVTH
jgi:urease accessory protein